MLTAEGKVIVPGGCDIWPHELNTAKALSRKGHTIEFLPRIEGTQVKSADILMDGIVWEMKSPTSSSIKSLQKVLRRAGKQSHNVVVDTSRMKGVSDRDAQRELSRLLPLVASVHRLRMVTKNRNVIDIG